ncbi:hypothetical protein, partial [Mesorhizobium sp. M5C.F.Ca.IN.020.32.2.1]
MRRRERLTALLEKRDRLEEERSQTRTRLAEAGEELTKAMSPAWAALIRPRLATAVADLRARESDLQVAVTRAQVLHSLAHGSDPSCPTCLQMVGKDAQAKIRALVDGGTDAGDDASQRELASARRRLDALEAQLAAANPEALRILWARQERLQNDIYSASAAIEEIDKQLTGDAEDELRGLRRDYDSVLRQIVATEEGIRATQQRLSETATYRDNI